MATQVTPPPKFLKTHSQVSSMAVINTNPPAILSVFAIC